MQATEMGRGLESSSNGHPSRIRANGWGGARAGGALGRQERASLRPCLVCCLLLLLLLLLGLLHLLLLLRCLHMLPLHIAHPLLLIRRHIRQGGVSGQQRGGRAGVLLRQAGRAGKAGRGAPVRRASGLPKSSQGSQAGAAPARQWPMRPSCGRPAAAPLPASVPHKPQAPAPPQLACMSFSMCSAARVRLKMATCSLPASSASGSTTAAAAPALVPAAAPAGDSSDPAPWGGAEAGGGESQQGTDARQPRSALLQCTASAAQPRRACSTPAAAILCSPDAPPLRASLLAQLAWPPPHSCVSSCTCRSASFTSSLIDSVDRKGCGAGGWGQ